MRILVLGGGSWGIALATLLHKNGHRVSIWEFFPDEAARLANERESKSRLPGTIIPDDIAISSDLESFTKSADLICFVVPSHTVRAAARELSALRPEASLYVNCAKGIENKSLKRMSEVILDEMLHLKSAQVLTLSGPSHAEEVAARLPTSVVVAGESEMNAMVVQETFNNDRFRVYSSTDLAGVELGGSVKNVIAIASGICQGLGFGDNTSGALITRGLAEIVRLGERMNADPMTFAGLSGLGDLVTTCLSRHSRNRFVGEEIGKGRKLRDILSGMSMVAEGVRTTESVHSLAEREDLEMPITEEVYRILFEEKDPKLAVRDLMTRDLKAEI